jgi:hypothetical protein
VLVAAVVALVLGVRIGRADDDSDRAALLHEIDGYLHDAADKLRNAASASDGRYVDDARSLIAKLPDRLSALARVKGSDSRAATYVDRYGNYARDFDRAAQQLGALKAEQRSIADLPQRCTNLDKQLADTAARFEADKDGTRIEELRRTAISAGDQADTWARDADQRRDAQTRRASDAKSFSVSDGEWSGVTSALQDAAGRSLDAWMHDYADVDRACKDLRQRDRHPAVDRALRALASTASGRDQIYVQLDDKLKRIESNIGAVFDDSSSSRVADSQSLMSDMDRLVRDLASQKGADKKANQIADAWPAYIAAWQRAATVLAGLKDAERELDDVPYKCSVAARDLADKMDTYLRAKDPDGLTAIPALATSLGEKYTSALSQVDATRSAREQGARTIAEFQPADDRWQPLRRAMKDAADRLYAYWDQHRQKAHEACDDLARGSRNPAVEKFLAALGAQAQSDLADFQAQVAAWERDARDIYQLDCKDMQDLWDAWCSIDYAAADAPEQPVIEQQTTAVIERERAKIGAILDRLPPLRRRAAELAAKPKYRDAIDKLSRDSLDKQEGRLKSSRRRTPIGRATTTPHSRSRAATASRSTIGSMANTTVQSTTKRIPGSVAAVPTASWSMVLGRATCGSSSPSTGPGRIPLPATSKQ